MRKPRNGVSSVRMPSRWIAGIGALLLVTSAVTAGQVASPAHAIDLPTWADVEAAKQNEAAGAAKVVEIEGLIAQSQAELERLRNESAAANERASAAEAAFQTAAEKSALLDVQAAESQQQADAAADQAAALVSQMYRSGGVDRSLELFLEADGETADALLERLASMSKATERNTVISEEAQQAMNTASSLGEQAELARGERERLSAEAEREAEVAAQAAATQLEKITEQEDQQEVLQAQLAALKDETVQTVAGYEERLAWEAEQRRLAEIAAAEAARKAAEEAAAAAAAAAAANPGGGGGGGGGNSGGGGGGGGYVGWVRPTSGWISTYYYQVPFHTGIDIAAACGTPIYAAQSGTVTFVGWKDNFGGNMIHVDHADGFQTRYAHLSRFAVNWGQWVAQGQIIGYVGTTGMSTGCHLHYEVLSWGSFVNPIPNFVAG